ncbi:MAG: molybdenum cofactor biosynthesis protein MoaE [Gammaproteobacteria bacterium]|nr:molybdenum cofactor biosynthesis protein MoaE [Gammaproteobacteria bacterium]
MPIRICEQPFDPWAELVRYQDARPGDAGQFGATAAFVGSMRDFNEDQAVTEMFLEHYPGMTEKHLEEICERASQRWEILDSLVLHRVGRILPGEAIVLVAVWSAHRAEAYESNRFIMEDLKAKAPFWKKESLKDSLGAETRWVRSNRPGST